MADLSLILGGIGLFILGISLLTEGLKGYVGDNLRLLLVKYISGNTSAIMVGALVAVLVQSSSATIFATIGFVSAGLLTFSQSIGLVLGANLGTTSTTWIVSVLGFKFSVSLLAMPLIFVGSLLRVLGKEKKQSLGITLAGFGLIFVALEMLQTGMSQYSGVVQRLLDEQFGSSLLPLIAIGILMTVVMQSSSAALATTLAALHQEVIAYDQALVLAIGQNLGTTVKALIATFGASRAAQRTALFHILFNVVAAIVALLLLSWLGRICWQLSVTLFTGAQELIALSFFHTIFNLIGVLIFLPWLNRFAALIQWLLPDLESGPLRNLDDSVLEVIPVAIEAAERALREVSLSTAEILSQTCNSAGLARDKLSESQRSLAGIWEFVGKMGKSSQTEAESKRFLSLLHALDHFDQLYFLFKERPSAAGPDSPNAVELRQKFFALFKDFISSKVKDQSTLISLQGLCEEMKALRHKVRYDTLERAARRETELKEAFGIAEEIRFWDASLYHLWRIAHHLGKKIQKPDNEPRVQKSKVRAALDE